MWPSLIIHCVGGSFILKCEMSYYLRLGEIKHKFVVNIIRTSLLETLFTQLLYSSMITEFLGIEENPLTTQLNAEKTPNQLRFGLIYTLESKARLSARPQFGTRLFSVKKEAYF